MDKQTQQALFMALKFAVDGVPRVADAVVDEIRAGRLTYAEMDELAKVFEKAAESIRTAASAYVMHLPYTQARIKPGAVVGSDFRFCRWGELEHYGKENPDLVFDIEPHKGMWLVEARAYGFGQQTPKGQPYDSGAYGNGSVYVRVDDLIPVYPYGVPLS